MKGLFKLLAVLLFAICLLGNVFAGGGQQKGSNDAKTLKFFGWGAGTDLNSEEQRLTRIFEKYYQETGVRVTGDFNDDYWEVLELKVPSGSSDYDVMVVDLAGISNYAVRGGFLIPLDKYFTRAELDGYVPVAKKAATWDGKFYAPPLNNSSQILWWNQDLLDQAGVKVRPSDVNNRLTYEEVVEYARQALSKLDPNRTNGISGLIFEQVSMTYQMLPIPNSMGAKNIGDDGFTVDGIINSPEWVKAMTWYQNLFKDGLALRGFTTMEVPNLFNSGKIIFMVGGTWNDPSVVNRTFKVGFAPVPAFKGYEDKVGTATGSWHIGVVPSSKKQDLAAAFVKWMTLGEGNSLYTFGDKQLNIIGTGQLPATMAQVNSILNDPNANPVMKIAVYESTHTAVPRAITPGYNEYHTIMDATFEDIRNGSDVKPRLDRAVRDINSALVRYKR